MNSYHSYNKWTSINGRQYLGKEFSSWLDFILFADKFSGAKTVSWAVQSHCSIEEIVNAFAVGKRRGSKAIETVNRSVGHCVTRHSILFPCLFFFNEKTKYNTKPFKCNMIP